MIRVRVSKLAPLGPRYARLDVGDVAEKVAIRMRDHYQQSHRGGLNSDGTPLPLSEEGLPLGVGSGTIVDNWSTIRDGTATTVEPFQEGRYAIAVSRLAARGVVYHTVEGTAAQVLLDACTAECDLAVRKVAVAKS